MIKAQVEEILYKNEICEIGFRTSFAKLYMLGLELVENLQVGSNVLIGFNTSDVLLLDSQTSSSSRNCFKAKILNIEVGEIISTAKLAAGEFTFDAIFSSKVKLENGEIWVYINETSVYISEII